MNEDFYIRKADNGKKEKKLKSLKGLKEPKGLKKPETDLENQRGVGGPLKKPTTMVENGFQSLFEALQSLFLVSIEEKCEKTRE